MKQKCGVTGHRHGSRTRSLTGTFGPIEIAVPRARLNTADGKTSGVEEPGAAGLSAAHACRRRADRRLLPGRHQYAPGAPRARGPVWRRGRQGHVSRIWRKVKSDWDAWNARSLAGEPIVRLILDGTVVRVRLDRKATSISLLVVLGVREDGQKVLLAIKSMGGESTEAWRTVLDDLHRARAAAARVPHRRRRRRARQGHRRRLGRRAGPALHGPQAQEPVRARARAPA